MIKVFVPGLRSGSTSFSSWIDDGIPVATLEEADLMVLRGGQDINPVIYGDHSLHPQTQEPNRTRDFSELVYCIRAERMGIPIIGICRGAQMLSGFSGNRLVQHVNNHTGEGHDMYTIDGKKFVINSLHHQMQWPIRKDAEVLAWADRSTVREDENGEQVLDRDIEVVYYGNINSLGIQAHPEFETNGPVLTWYNDIIREYLFSKKNKFEKEIENSIRC